MKVSELDYQLPQELIASFPTPKRTDARLLHVDRSSLRSAHYHFRDLERFFRPGDVLVLNDTKVVPARLLGYKPTGGKVEALLLKKKSPAVWTAMLKPGGRIRKGMMLRFESLDFSRMAEVLDDSSPNNPERILKFDKALSEKELDALGHIPIPPYLGRADEASDRENYQTVFAKNPGAVASPTAGLHFDQKLLDALCRKGVEIVYITLHVGLGTFQPVDAENIEHHKMHQEEFEISETASRVLCKARAEGRRIIACGTTSVRVLESSARENVPLRATRGVTELLIYPPYDFKVVSGMITNFHLPKTTLLFLVAAMIGKERLLAVYREAVSQKYRFFSYGDAMLIL